MSKIPCLDLKGQHEQIKKEIFEAFEKVYEKTAFSGGPFVEEFEKISSKTDSRDKGTDVIYSIIASHAINSAISTIEIEKCFTGDPALYKWQKELMVYKPNDDSFVPVISDERTLEAWIDKHDPDGDKSSYSAYYMITGRDVDKIKRLSSVLSTGTNLRTKWGDTKD